MKKLSDYIDDIGVNIFQQQAGFPTGIYSLNQTTFGLQRGEQVIIGGRSSMGKTSLLLDFVMSANANSILFSLEMSAKEIIRRILSQLTGIPFNRIRRNTINNSERTRLQIALEELKRRNILLEDRTGLTIQQIDSIIQQANTIYPIECIFIDYLQLVRSTERYRNRVDEVSEISAGLKGLSKHYNIVNVVACQLNRSADSREDTSFRPQLSDLRESGSIENDADIVLLIYRPYYYNRRNNPSLTDDGRAEIIVAKNRNGETKTISCTFDNECMSFTRGEINRLSEQLF